MNYLKGEQIKTKEIKNNNHRTAAKKWKIMEANYFHSWF